MYFILYQSQACIPVTDLPKLLVECNLKNIQQGITGLLLYLNGQFMQIFEGDEAAVQALYEKIKTDSRHEQVVILEQGTQEGRQFPDWAMGFYAGSDHSDMPLPAHINLSQNQLIFEAITFNSHPALKHLTKFYHQFKP